jgi:hypothetical protein
LQLKAEFEKSTENSVQEAIADYKTFNQLPETTPDEIERKAKAYKKFIDGRGFTFLKAMADTQCAQFFIPKTEANKDYLMTDADFRLILSGYKGWQDRKVAKATSVALEQRFFHWFIEFPEVFAKGGFDCILGNPPYLGGTKISTFNGDAFFNYCVTNFPYASGRCDLIGYFIRRIFDLQMNNSFHSIITTNTIAEGDTREGGFDYILKKGGVINFAMKNVKWPGKANVIITLYSLHKGEFNRSIYLAGNKVGFITSYLTEESYLTTPKKIKANEKKAFMGSSITGDGFQVSNSQIKKLIEASHEYEKIIYKYANGFDFNNIPDHISDKRIINFFNEDLEYIARKYPLALDIVEQFVKPEREKKSVEVSSAPWWKYWRIREDLYSSISNNSKILVLTRASSTHGFAFINTDNYVFSDALIVFNYDSYVEYSILQSNLHEDWSWRFSSKLKTDRRYSVTDCFETFPFPQNLTPTQEQALEKIGEQYHEHRKQLMLAMQLGLTKMYNAFHAKGVNSEWLGNTATVEVGEMKMVNARPDNFGGKLQMVNSKWQMPSGAKPDKQMELLYKHINKLDTNMDMIEAVQGIEELRALHVKMDHAVLDAYGWNDIQLLHNFYEVDYLPENDRVRFTIHPNARKEILKRLLELNHKIYNEEMHNGRHKKEDTIKYFKEKGIDMPAELQLIFNEVKKSKKKEIKRTDGSKVQKLF